MRRSDLSLAILLSAGTLLSSIAAYSRGSMVHDEPWNAEHIHSLPAEIQDAIIRLCGSNVHAQHYFATFLDHARRIRLHFERAHCRNDQPICDETGCLHQEYILTGGRYRLLRTYRGPGTD